MFSNRKHSFILKGRDAKVLEEAFSDTMLARATTSDPAPGSKEVNTKKWLCVSVHAEEAGIIELERLFEPLSTIRNKF